MENLLGSVVDEYAKDIDENSQEYSGSMVLFVLKSTRYSVKIPITLTYIHTCIECGVVVMVTGSIPVSAKTIFTNP